MARRLGKADDVAGIHDRIPAESFAACRSSMAPDAALAAIGHRRIAIDIEGEFLVLGADAPLVARFVAFGQVFDEFVKVFNWPEIGSVARHCCALRT